MNIRLFFAAFALAVYPLAVQGQKALAIAGTPAEAVSRAVTLRYKFAPGQVQRYKIVIDTMTKNFIGKSGTRVPITYHVEETLAKTVKAIRDADGTATIEIKTEQVSVKTNSSNTRYWKGMQAALVDPRTVLMTPTGKILSYQSDNSQESKILGMSFSKGIISSNSALPQNSVRIGEEWNSTTALGMMTNSTLVELKIDNSTKKIAKIVEKINSITQKNISQNILIPMKETSQVTGYGTIYFDTDAGAALSRDMTININSRFAFGSYKTSTLSIPSHTFLLQSQMHIKMVKIDDTPALVLGGRL